VVSIENALVSAARSGAPVLNASAMRGSDRLHHQGLTLVRFSAQLKRFVWDRGCIKGLFRGCLRGIRGIRGIRGCLGCILCQIRLRLS